MEETAQITILKASNDKREYRRIVLPNQLQVLLISDPETDKAAAAMDVNVGHFSDPDDLQGLAHFLEHMLFFSSAKYPIEDSYMKFLIEHGGHTNAYTSSEHTNFHFDVNADHLEEALDRFAQFFICPLMSADATSREMNAVDSENKKNLTTDYWRFDQLSRHNSFKGHPYHKFGTGNLETLDVHPKSRGLDTREELVKFYERHYSSNLMCLVVYGKENLENIQNMVEIKLSAIKNTNKSPPKFSGQPCHPEDLQILIKAVPVKEGHSLLLSWPITPEILCYKEGPSQYLSHLLGHEADGSLFALLKSLGFATGLSAGERDQSLEYAFFIVSIELTDLGQSQVEDVIGLTFQYIKILQEEGAAEWIFQEVKALREINFHFQDKNAPVDYVTHLAHNMQLYPPEDWLVGSSLPSIFNVDSIMKVVRMLTPENARILWASKEFEQKTTDVEPWYGTPFSIENIRHDLVKQWRAASIDTRLHLPSANPFLPTDLSIKLPNDKSGHPCLLRVSSMSKLWHKPDFTFQTPKACIKIHFNLPESNSSPQAFILTAIFLQLLVDYLNEYVYYAEVAGLHYNIYQTKAGFQVSISGYNHKMAMLLEKIIEKISNFKVREDRFLVVKEKILKDYLNFRFRQPYQQALYYSSLFLQHKTWDLNAYLEVIPSLQAADLSAFSPRMLSRIFFECYVAGNMTGKEAESLSLMIETLLSDGHELKSKSIFDAQHVERRIVKLNPEAEFYYPIAGLNMLDANSALQFYLQIGQDDTTLNVLLELFILSAKQEVFHQLRSVQQLGYIVALMNRDDFGVRGAQFIIQSAVKDPKEIDSRVEDFLSSFENNLNQLTDEEFKRNVNALIEIKLEKHKNLREETGFYWNEIDDGTLKFERQKDEVAALRKLNREQLIEFYDNYIRFDAPKRAKLSIHVYGGSHEQEFKSINGETVSPTPLDGITATSEDHRDMSHGTIENGKEDQISKEKKVMKPVRIENIFSFKRSQSLYSSLK